MFVPIGDWDKSIVMPIFSLSSVLFVPIGDWDLSISNATDFNAYVLFVPIGDWDLSKLFALLKDLKVVLFVPIGDWDLDKYEADEKTKEGFVCTYRGLRLKKWKKN